MVLAPQPASASIATRVVAGLLVLALIAMAQLAHLPAAHGDGGYATHAVDTPAGKTTGPSADAPPAMHGPGDCAGPECGACAAVFMAAVAEAGPLRGSLEPASSPGMMGPPADVPFRPPTHPV